MKIVLIKVFQILIIGVNMQILTEIFYFNVCAREKKNHMIWTVFYSVKLREFWWAYIILYWRLWYLPFNLAWQALTFYGHQNLWLSKFFQHAYILIRMHLTIKAFPILWEMNRYSIFILKISFDGFKSEDKGFRNVKTI